MLRRQPPGQQAIAGASKELGHAPTGDIAFVWLSLFLCCEVTQYFTQSTRYIHQHSNHSSLFLSCLRLVISCPTMLQQEMQRTVRSQQAQLNGKTPLQSLLPLLNSKSSWKRASSTLMVPWELPFRSIGDAYNIMVKKQAYSMSAKKASLHHKLPPKLHCIFKILSPSSLTE